MSLTSRTVSIYTLGCKVNQYESEAIAEGLTSRGFSVVPFSQVCDAYIINTCTVTAESDRKARQLIRRAIKTNPSAYILVTGCMAEVFSDKISKIDGVDYICGNGRKLQVIEAIEKLFAQGHKNTSPEISISPLDSFEEMQIAKFDRTRAYIKIEDGCENRCTYCIIPEARGKVRSKAPSDVLSEVRTLTDSGCREIVLTGIETASYGRDFDNDYRLADLLEEVDAIPNIGRIRLGSLDPSLMKPDFVNRIAKLKSLTPHFHLSMQSGSDKILALMKRKYNQKMALEGMERLRAAMPGVQFTTDIIVGFPGETEEDFALTVDFAKQAKFLMIHVFPYSERRGTVATTLPGRVPEEIRHERVRRLSAVQAEIQKKILDSYTDTAVSVLFETYTKGIAIGHTDTFVEVSCPAPHALQSQLHTVYITGNDGKTCTVFFVRAKTNKQEVNDMTYSSPIHNFRKINIEQAEDIRAQLSLSMSADTLIFCANYYKKQLKRDPFADEIKMLDMLTIAKKQLGDSLALTEFFASDAFVATTYADMLKKHRQRHPEIKRPITLAETLNVANEVLDSKKKSRSSVFSFIEDTRNDIDAAGNSSVVNQNSAYRLRMFPLSNSPASAGDICILLCPLEKDSQKKFREKVAALLQNNEIMQFVKDVAQVGDGGILKQLLTMTQGVHIHLPALSLDGNPIPATNLCSRFWGCYILRLSQKQWNLASAPLGRGGVRAIPFATTLQKNKVVFARNKQSSFAIDTRFLHSLNSYKEVCVKLGSESIRPISVRLGEITELHSDSYVASSVTPANSYYRTAVWSVLASVLSLCACGVPYRKQKLTTAIEIPKNLSSNDIGKYLSAVLGLYRAQKELELTSKSNTFVQRNKDASAPMFHIWAVGKKIKTIPNQFSKKRSFVYVVTPPWDEIGLPDFAAFQKTANFVAKLARKGKIRSCRVFSCEKIADGIRQMSGDYTCVFSKNAMFEEDKLPLYILIESRKRLPWQRIGKVRQVDDDSAQIGIDE